MGTLKGINEIEAEIVSLVRNTVSNTLRATGAVATAVNAVKGILIGVVGGVKEVATTALPKSTSEQKATSTRSAGTESETSTKKRAKT